MMKKLLFLASALAGFAGVAVAQDANTVKTTTVQYQVPTCTNCRTTTEVRTVYPEATPVMQHVEPVYAAPVMVEETVVEQAPQPAPISLKKPCKSNNDLPIRNPLFVLGKGKFSALEAVNGYREPKRKLYYDASVGDYAERMEYKGWDAHMHVTYGITDRWSVRVWGGKQYSRPKKEHWVAANPGTAVLHNHAYDVNLGTYYHLIDSCYFDMIVGLETKWHRHKYAQGDDVKRENGWGWSPTVTMGGTFGWFTPYITLAYQYDHTKRKEDNGRKHWSKDRGYYLNPGIYIQPSKWFAINFNIQKEERAEVKPQWNLGVDFYPYKNVVFGIEANTRRPYDDPMHMYGAAAFAKIVF